MTLYDVTTTTTTTPTIPAASTTSTTARPDCKTPLFNSKIKSHHVQHVGLLLCRFK